MNPKLAVLAALVALLPLAAGAQSSYRCVGKDGKKYYGSTVPPQCLGQPVEQLNSQGMVVKRFDAAASAAEREKKAAEEEERKKREAISKEEGRRNRALLATYTSEKDIDQARGRALKDNEGAVKDIETRIGGAQEAPGRPEEGARVLPGQEQAAGQARAGHQERRVRHQDAGRPAGGEERRKWSRSTRATTTTRSATSN